MKVAILLAVLLPACLALPMDKVDQRIVNGADASEGQFKHMVYLTTDGFACGASILSPTHILTAAHCLDHYPNPTKVKAKAGVIDKLGSGVVIYGSKYVIHPEYDQKTTVNDIAIVKLQTPFLFGGNIQPIALRQTPPRAAEVLTLSGWGNVTASGDTTNRLQYFRVLTIDVKDCAKQFPGNQVLPSNVCTHKLPGEGACSGDSGGPLIDYEGNQVGIASWVGLPCGGKKPDVYTNVYYFRDWIVEQMNSL